MNTVAEGVQAVDVDTLASVQFLDSSLTCYSLRIIGTNGSSLSMSFTTRSFAVLFGLTLIALTVIKSLVTEELAMEPGTYVSVCGVSSVTMLWLLWQ